MQLIFLSRGRGHMGQMRLSAARVWLTTCAVALVICAGAFYGGFRAAEVLGVSNPQAQVTTWQAELALR